MMKRLILLCLFIPVSLPGPLLSEAKQLTENETKKSVIKIKNYSQSYDFSAPWNARGVQTSYGSGFLVGPGKIMTNAHVVSESKILRVQKNEGTKWYKARILHIAHDCDLALLTVDDPAFFEGMKVMPISGLPSLNTLVSVYGFPVGGAKLSITKGIVSRIEIQEYAHSQIDAHLAIQVDAAINPGNSGGPVLQNGKLIGVAFQSFASAENTGYVIPTEVVRHFLNDIKDNKYDGYVDLGIITVNLENGPLRRYYKMQKREGVLVTSVIPDSGADGKIKPGDIITAIEGKQIAYNGTIEGNGDTRLHYTSVVEQRYLGDKITLSVLRGKTETDVSFNLLPLAILNFKKKNFEKRPRYFLRAGLLFQPAVRNVLETGSRKWSSYDRSLHIYLYENYLSGRIYKDRRRFVVLYDILPDPVNTYYRNFKGMVVDSVNGKKVETLSQLKSAWQHTKGDWVKVEFLWASTPLLLRKSDIDAANHRIKKRYQVSNAEFLGDEK